MEPRAIVDTGYLVALLNRHDAHHRWAVDALDRLPGPWSTSEACISECVFILESAGKLAVEKLLVWIESALLIPGSFLPDSLSSVRHEMLRYRDRWVDYVDACIVVLSDSHPRLPVATVDASDFVVYFRMRGKRQLIMP